jgi:hypothetical protein
MRILRGVLEIQLFIGILASLLKPSARPWARARFAAFLGVYPSAALQGRHLQDSSREVGASRSNCQRIWRWGLPTLSRFFLLTVR